MERIYMGNLDDRVALYPWHGKRVYLADYLNQLMQQIIIGRNPLINDGYMIQNKLLRNEMFYGNSLFLDLFTSGAATIPYRQKSLGELIDEQRTAGISSFLTITRETESRIASFDAALGRTSAREPGPSSMEIWNGFYELLLHQGEKAALNISNHWKEELISEYDLRVALEKFLSTDRSRIPGGRPPSRTQWELTVDELEKSGALSYGLTTKRLLMNFANEAYHYNYAQQVSLKCGDDVAVQTSLSPAFSFMIREQKIDANLDKKKITMIRIPYPNSLGARGSLEKLMGDTGVGRSRKNFISELAKFRSSTLTDRTVDDLNYAANTYNYWIDREFGKKGAVSGLIKASDFALCVSSPTAGAITAALQWGAVNGAGWALTHLASKNHSELNYLDQHMVAATLKKTSPSHGQSDARPLFIMR